LLFRQLILRVRFPLAIAEAVRHKERETIAFHHANLVEVVIASILLRGLGINVAPGFSPAFSAGPT